MHMKLVFPTIVLLFTILAPAWSVEQIPWNRNYDQAVALAKKNSQPIFVDVYAEWCAWCHVLDKEVYTDPKFITFMKGFVTLKADAEDNKDGTKLAEKYNVDGLPTLLVIDPSGSLLLKITGFRRANELVDSIGSTLTLLEREKKNPQDVQASVKLADLYLDGMMFDAAETRYQRVVSATGVTPQQKEKALFSLALTQYYQQKLDASLVNLNTYYANYKGGKSEEDALLLLAQINVEKKSNVVARKYLQEFLAKYPKSKNASRVKQVLTSIDKELAQK